MEGLPATDSLQQAKKQLQDQLEAAEHGYPVKPVENESSKSTENESEEESKLVIKTEQLPSFLDKVKETSVSDSSQEKQTLTQDKLEEQELVVPENPEEKQLPEKSEDKELVTQEEPEENKLSKVQEIEILLQNKSENNTSEQDTPEEIQLTEESEENKISQQKPDEERLPEKTEENKYEQHTPSIHADTPEEKSAHGGDAQGFLEEESSDEEVYQFGDDERYKDINKAYEELRIALDQVERSLKAIDKPLTTDLQKISKVLRESYEKINQSLTPEPKEPAMNEASLVVAVETAQGTTQETGPATADSELQALELKEDCSNTPPPPSIKDSTQDTDEAVVETRVKAQSDPHILGSVTEKLAKQQEGIHTTPSTKNSTEVTNDIITETKGAAQLEPLSSGSGRDILAEQREDIHSTPSLSSTKDSTLIANSAVIEISPTSQPECLSTRSLPEKLNEQEAELSMKSLPETNEQTTMDLTSKSNEDSAQAMSEPPSTPTPQAEKAT